MTGASLNLEYVARAVGTTLPSNFDHAPLAGICTDSRKLAPGELFVALRGENFDGHEFLAQAFERGAAAALVQATWSDDRLDRGHPGRPVLRTPDTLKALGDLAAALRRDQPLEVVALTGSNGKTTTKEMLARVLGRSGPILATQGNLNNLVGLPLTLFRLEPGQRRAVLEMGMNQPGEIARLTAIADPDVGLITNIGPAHVAGLGSIAGVARAKGELFAHLGPRATAVVNLDDPRVVRQAARFGGTRLTFGFGTEAMVRARIRKTGPEGTAFTLITPANQAEVRFRLLGRHNVGNALAAAAAAAALGLDPEEIAAGLEDFSPFPGRLVPLDLPGTVKILDDTYNANPASTEAALTVLESFRSRKGRLIAVLGDMLELGPVSRPEHARLGRLAAETGLDILVVVGTEARALGLAAKKSPRPPALTIWFPDAPAAAEWLVQQVRKHDRILVKGSRGMRMERIVARLNEEG